MKPISLLRKEWTKICNFKYDLEEGASVSQPRPGGCPIDGSTSPPSVKTVQCQPRPRLQFQRLPCWFMALVPPNYCCQADPRI